MWWTATFESIILNHEVGCMGTEELYFPFIAWSASGKGGVMARDWRPPLRSGIDAEEEEARNVCT